MALLVTYEDVEYVFDIEDMDTDEARAMERYGVKNLKALEEGISEGEVDALSVAFWLMRRQNGEPGARLDHVKFKPVKFIKSLMAAKLSEDVEESEEGKAEEG